MFFSSLERLFLYFIIFPFSFCLAQKSRFADPANFKKAEALSAQYPKAEFAILEETSSIDFSVNSKAGSALVQADLEETRSLITLKDNNTYSDAIFYDNESFVGRVLYADKLDRTASSPVYTNCGDYKQDGIFYSDAKVCYYSVDIGSKGYVGKVAYAETYKDVKYLTKIFFHESYPILKRVIEFNVPNWLDIEFKEINTAGYQIKREVKENKGKETKTYSFTLENLIGLQSEPNSPAHSLSFPHIVVLAKKFTYKGKSYQLFESVKDLYAWYNSLTKQVKNDLSVYKSTAEKLTAGKKTDIEKVKAIYYWVQDNIRYIAFENGIMGFKPETAQNVFSNKYGDCKGMANLLKNMLTSIGFDARLTWIGTSDLPYDYSIPSLCVDNHMICTLILNGKRYFLDGTEKFIELGSYAERIQGKQVLIEDGENFIIDSIPVSPKSRNTQITDVLLKMEGDDLTGKISKVYKGEQKTSILYGASTLRSDTKDDALKRYFVSGNKNIQVSTSKMSSLEERDNDFIIDMDVVFKNAITKTDNEIYVNLDFDREFANLTFDSTRVNDYEFSHKKVIKTVTKFEIPSGFQVDYMPSLYSSDSDCFSFSLSMKKEGNFVIYSKEISIKHAVLSKENFKKWNTAVKGAKKFYNDLLTLKKL